MVTEEMILKCQVLIPGGHLQDIDQGEASLVVLKHCGTNQGGVSTFQLHLSTDFLEQSPHGKDLSHGHAEGYIFSCSGAQSLVCLQLAGPQNGAPKQCQSEPCSGPHTDWILVIFMTPQSGKVSIQLAVQSFLQVGHKLQPSVPCFHQVADNVLDCLAMGFLGTVGKSTHLVNCKLKVWPSVGANT